MEDYDEGESGHEEGIKEGRAGGNNGDSEAIGLKEDSSSGCLLYTSPSPRD